ncbi:ExbD/TolR family protein [Haloferula sargassicola]|uniref:Biopolymer transporter ExbD n=1 Tax=Haloferula sargassicola TaxID=490096 RepID=A0ABP9UQP1_9BACT
MKLVSTLPDRVGFLHVVPVLDLLALLLIALLLGPSFLNQSGIQVEMPVSRYQLARTADARVITLTAGDPVVIWLGRDRVSEDELVSRLKEEREGSTTIPIAYLRSDQAIPAGEERRIAELVLGSDFRVYLLGRPKEGER